MKIMLAAAASALALAAIASPAAAQDPEVSFNIGATSDYVFRGVSQTQEDPALQAGFDVTSGSWYGGVWGSTVDFGDGTDGEIDVYAGYRSEVAGFSVDVGAIGYFYVEEPANADYGYYEAKLAASRAVGPATIGAAIYYSPDFFGIDEEAFYTELNAGYAVTSAVALTGAIGQQKLDVTEDYTTWNAGLTWTIYEGLAIDARYHDTDTDGPLTDDRFVATLKFVL